ncbi:CCR4-NOT transcription complex subunit 7/8 [Nematocida parisii]|uniref:poly(A)-specific ribonuclease n=1 Tax=Nematocida parisii (strain ERTm3) TaxID=935791 RepID=I3EIN3_NEMP3|nr:CCR4-NOT transcription complex subunit 7 [Nematocida parisii ERTm1]EIJ89080.1 CCR4-NOT transcription complex subunit 7 [Nematocida parisii ERTm3]KAI5125933.1 CCR4-NOT transcription complex subunit 7/8 [Nematocida parisii]KAI5166742.1 CCR4-NOT transcription complex subunit 7/8 [Nematocida sp. AWRm79]KAI5183769.1 CCR4-NOT transcription complex subunit 7/8 [Nematocida sp. AWRm78]OAG29176.1 CCR4-NOT transcription complex subunit 7/8 [Nematocida sp. ERTm5]|eukprot:XP_013059535.1 CCR4-NOT transcription complex subunit 7 [Nematocida parisii ERTm1]
MEEDRITENEIRNVWKHNLEEEIELLSQKIKEYPYIAMDTEFPGVIAKPIGTFTAQTTYTYNQLRCNVSILSLIQLGISLSNEKGEKPIPSTWQFNFHFDKKGSMSARESMYVLEQAGIDFDRLYKDGINIEVFAELITVSGILMNKSLKWISFHSSYDFGYFIKAVMGQDLPPSIEEFSYVLSKVFPYFYDIKYLINTLGMKGGLQDLADHLSVCREGTQHQAGSDALLTLKVFHMLKTEIIPDAEQNTKYKCKLFGIDSV